MEAAARLTDRLRERGYTQISVLQPEQKDWNEDLQARSGLEIQPAEEPLLQQEMG